ncbi:MAG: hypothetical protein ACO1N3_00030 [Gammaproteobacteria bacterium]
MSKILTVTGSSYGETLFLNQSLKRFFNENNSPEQELSPALQHLNNDLNDPKISVYLVGITASRSDPIYLVALRPDGKKRFYEIETEANLKFDGKVTHVKEHELPEHAKLGFKEAQHTFDAMKRDEGLSTRPGTHQ